MRQQKIVRSKPKVTEVIDNRTKITTPEMEDLPTETKEASQIPVRTVLYVEVGSATTGQVANLVSKINEQYKEGKGGKHYIVPVRNGQLTNDVFFEKEFLSIVEKLCEVKDGKIGLKYGAQDVNVIRMEIQ